MTLLQKIRAIAQVAARHPFCIAVETYATCNRKCDYCPVAHYVRPKDKMSWETFAKIVATAKAAGFTGDFQFVGYSEPMLDKRLTDMLIHARKELPRSKMIIMTNGDLLSKEILQTWSEHCDVVLVTHHDRTDFTTFISTFVGQMEVIEQPKITEIRNRANSTNVPGVTYEPTRWCRRQFVMSIAATGGIRFCCEEWVPGKGAINVNTSPNFYQEWRAWRRTLKRVGILFNAPTPECEGCGVNKTNVVLRAL